MQNFKVTVNISMHIEFKLPTGAGGQAAYYGCSILRRELDRWRDLYGFEYTTEITHYKLTVRFSDERAYTVFALCWPIAQIRWQIYSD